MVMLASTDLVRGHTDNFGADATLQVTTTPDGTAFVSVYLQDGPHVYLRIRAEKWAEAVSRWAADSQATGLTTVN